MNNIFENAYFGKTYRTKDGRKVLYLSSYKCNSDAEGEHVIHRLVTEHDGIFLVHNDGSYAQNDIYSNWNVVSEWKEEINEEELDKLAMSYCEQIVEKEVVDLDKDECVDSYNGFKAGYCKAKKNYE